MSWAKLDDGFTWNTKVVEAGNEATGIYARALAHCGGQLTDGYVPQKVARLIADGRKQPLEALVANGLWEAVDGGYRIVNYLEYNPSRADVEERRRKRADAGRIGGHASGRSRRGEADGQASASSKREASASAVAPTTDEPPSRPVPTRPDLTRQKKGQVGREVDSRAEITRAGTA